VINSVENDKSAAWFVDQRAIVLAVQRQPGSNTVAVAQGVKDILPEFRSQLPPSVSLHILFDRSESIRESFTDVKFTMWLTLGLVVLVIFLFLRNVSATLIPSLSLPMSIVGTFAVMQLLGFSLNNLSLMALILSLGFVVDDAIVMLRKHSAPHGDGEKTAPGGPGRFAGDRFHDPVDDSFSGGGFHSGAPDGRAGRAVVQRVRGFDQRGYPSVRLHLPDPDADVEQPNPCRAITPEPRAGVPGKRAILRKNAGRLRERAGLVT